LWQCGLEASIVVALRKRAASTDVHRGSFVPRGWVVAFLLALALTVLVALVLAYKGREVADHQEVLSY
jgi:hypothetical protein